MAMEEPSCIGFKPEKITDLVGEDYVEEILKEYLKSLSELLQSPAPIEGEHVCDDLHRQMHSFKSSSDFVGAYDLAKLAEELEKEWQTNPYYLEKSVEKYHLLCKKMVCLSNEIKHYLQLHFSYS